MKGQAKIIKELGFQFGKQIKMVWHPLVNGVRESADLYSNDTHHIYCLVSSNNFILQEISTGDRSELLCFENLMIQLFKKLLEYRIELTYEECVEQYATIIVKLSGDEIGKIIYSHLPSHHGGGHQFYQLDGMPFGSTFISLNDCKEYLLNKFSQPS